MPKMDGLGFLQKIISALHNQNRGTPPYTFKGSVGYQPQCTAGANEVLLEVPYFLYSIADLYTLQICAVKLQ